MTSILHAQFVASNVFALCSKTSVWLVDLNDLQVVEAFEVPCDVSSVSLAPGGRRATMGPNGDFPYLWDAVRSEVFELPATINARALGWVDDSTAIFGTPWGGVIHVDLGAWFDAPEESRMPPYGLGPGVTGAKYQDKHLIDDDDIDEYHMSDSARAYLRRGRDGCEVVEIIDGDCFNRYRVDEAGVTHTLNHIIVGGTHMVRSDFVLCGDDVLQHEGNRIRRLRIEDGSFVREYKVPAKSRLCTDFGQTRALLHLGNVFEELDLESGSRRELLAADASHFAVSADTVAACSDDVVRLFSVASREPRATLWIENGTVASAPSRSL